jgi:hypothetical protein
VAFAALAAGVVPIGLQGVLSGPSVALAQNLGRRTVSGAVLSDSGPVLGATVFIRSQKTKSIRSYTSTANGHFHFVQVNKAEDYELWAEKDGKKSAVKTVSSWDSRSEFVADLKLK